MRTFCLLLLLVCAPALAMTASEAESLLLAKDPRAAEAIASLLKAQPRSPEAWILQTQLLLQQGQDSKAVDAARKAVDFGPRDARAFHWLGNAYGNRIGQVGVLSQAMIAPKLRDAFERAVALDPDLHQARSNLVEYYLQAPAIAGGSVDKARAHAAELDRRDPPRGHYARGLLAMHDGDATGAAKAFAAAHGARPENKGYRMAAGLAYQQTGQWDEAFDLFMAWTREDPSATGAWYQLGRTSAMSGQRLAEGANALRRFLALPAAAGEPPKHHAWYRLGQVQARAGDKDAARISFEQALKGEPGNSDFRAALASL